MSCEFMEEKLNDHIDGYLSETESAEVERHLRECSACRQEAEEIRALHGAVAELPREIPPPADLWRQTAAAARAARPRAGRGPAWAPLASWTRPMLAAAAALLVVATAAVTLIVVRGRGETGPATRPVAPIPQEQYAGSSLVPDIAAAEAEFNRASAQLLEVLDRRRAELPADTIQTLDENLEKINQAIAEARAALEKDPYNPRLGHLVTAVHAKKVELLREAVKLAAPL